MHLSIVTDRNLRNIHLDKSFFQSTIIKRGARSETLTPMDKARHLVNDLGGNVKSYELYNEEKLIFKYEKEVIVPTDTEIPPTRGII